MSHGKKHNRARLSERLLRAQVVTINRDLRNPSLKFTAPQRFKLHERIEKLQAEIREVEIERLEDQEK